MRETHLRKEHKAPNGVMVRGTWCGTLTPLRTNNRRNATCKRCLKYSGARS